MNDLEQQLRRDLGAATGAPGPVVDAAGLARIGRRERTRRRGVLAAAAAVAAVVGVAGTTTVLADRDPAGEPAGPPRVTEGPRTSAPWWDGDDVHVLDEVVRTDPHPQNIRGVAFVGGTTVIAEGRERATRSRVRLVRDGVVVDLGPVGPAPSDGVESLSADGRVLGLAEPSGAAGWTIVLRDAASGAVLEEGTFADLAGRGPVGVAAVTLDGRVVLTRGGRTSMWTPGSDPVEVAGVRDAYAGAPAWPGGLTHSGPVDGSGLTYGTVDAEGRFEEVGTISGDGAWSADGRTWAYHGASGGGAVEGGAGGLWVQGPSLEPTEVPLPDALEAIVGWESARDVVVTVGPEDDVTWLRCDVVDLACEPTADPPPPGADYPRAAPG